MSQGNQGIVFRHMGAVGHVIEPLSSLYRKIDRSVFIHDVDRAEGPAVYFQRLPVLLCRIAVSFVIGVRFDDHRVLEALLVLQYFLHPGSRDDVRTVRFAGVELYCDFPADLRVYFFIRFPDSFRREITGKIDDRFVAGAFLIRDIDVSG